MTNKPPPNTLPFYFRMLIGLAYVIMALVFFTTNLGESKLGNQKIGYAFGIACLIYGCFRMYRAVQKWDTPDKENE